MTQQSFIQEKEFLNFLDSSYYMVKYNYMESQKVKLGV